LDRGNEAVVYERFLHHFPTFYGWKFENMVIRLLPDFLKKKGFPAGIIEKDWGNDYEFDFVLEDKNKVYIGEIKVGELNPPAEIKQIENITGREAFYKDKEIGYIFIANSFSRQIDDGNVLCAAAGEVFAAAVGDAGARRVHPQNQA
jgi:hypothetical protein